MIHMVDPRQNRLFDPFQGVIPPAGQRIIAEGWQGVFRHALLEVMPVGELAENFSRELGAPTKELYSMAGLVFLADFFGWTAHSNCCPGGTADVVAYAHEHGAPVRVIWPCGAERD